MMKFKNLLIFISGFTLSVVLTLSATIYLSIKGKIINSKSNIEKDLISIMLQDEKGNYEKTDKANWPMTGYRFNKVLSKCENGSGLSWTDNKVVVTTKTSDKCYVYFNNNKFVEDLSGNNHHGISSAAVWNEEGLTTSDASVTGNVNCGLENYDFSNGITLVARVKVNEFLNINQNFFGNWYNAGGGVFISNDKFYFNTYIDKWYTVTSNDSIILNTWYTIIGTFDNKTMKIYVNGDLKDETNVNGKRLTNKEPIMIGFSKSYITITYALIFDRAITTEEINDYNEEAMPSNKDNLLVWYNFK